LSMICPPINTVFIYSGFKEKKRHRLGQMPAYQARRYMLVYFNVAVWAVVGGAVGMVIWFA
ncbi:hypothetical protein ACVYZ3_005642, partial [Klebsiella pneumoniae]